ncbi:MAG TPA: hypothetical protein VG735_14880 [Caulobacterales bacterium]|nr:hypothetical protein [Caulobacterales bacterium]
MVDLKGLSAAELLLLHAQMGDALRVRGIVRTGNNPVGDLAEVLFCRAFGWRQSGNSNRSIDAISDDGSRIQIKGRRITRHNASRQLSAIRDLGGGHFDLLAAVLFSEDYTVQRAALVPRETVAARAKYVAHTNSHKFLLHDDVWSVVGVQDVTEALRQVRL